MPGRLVPRTWEYNPTIDAPARYKRACRYEAFVPDELRLLNVSLPAEAAGLVSEAEAAIRALNTTAQPALVPLARLLLRTESIASSKVEGMQMGVRELARAEARMETGGRRSQTAAEILANMSAMETAISEAAAVPHFGEPEVLAIHRRLMEQDTRKAIAGRFRADQNWIGGNDYNPCGADFVPPPAGGRGRGSWTDLCRRSSSESSPAAGLGGAGSRAVRDDPPLRRRQRPHRPGAHPRGPAPARPGTGVRAADQRGAGVSRDRVHRGADALPGRRRGRAGWSTLRPRRRARRTSPARTSPSRERCWRPGVTRLATVRPAGGRRGVGGDRRAPGAPGHHGPGRGGGDRTVQGTDISGAGSVTDGRSVDPACDLEEESILGSEWLAGTAGSAGGRGAGAGRKGVTEGPRKIWAPALLRCVFGFTGTEYMPK